MMCESVAFWWPKDDDDDDAIDRRVLHSHRAKLTDHHSNSSKLTGKTFFLSHANSWFGYLAWQILLLSSNY